ncbi:MAG: hypothetical protein SPI30_04110 [Prevotella sp.]|nr:hypothetical protein [Prevotella sp.]
MSSRWSVVISKYSSLRQGKTAEKMLTSKRKQSKSNGIRHE